MTRPVSLELELTSMSGKAQARVWPCFEVKNAVSLLVSPEIVNRYQAVEFKNANNLGKIKTHVSLYI